MNISVRDLTFSFQNGDFHYIDWGGRGPLAHFSHATGFCARAYTPLIERILSYLRMVGMDDRGHGRTTAPAHVDKLKDWRVFARDLERFLEHVRQPAVLMGHSRGAVASLLLSARRPELVRALVLIDPTILPFSWMWWWYLAKKARAAQFVPIAFRAARRKNLWPDRDTILQSYSSKEPFSKWEEGFLEGYIRDGTRETEDGLVRLSCDPLWESKCFATCSHDVWRFIPTLKMPTLLIHGEKSDICLPPTVKRFKEKVPEAKVIGLKGTSHFVPMERPDETADIIIGFLREQGII
ncbi:alpha/beta fold hydrolase [Thermodesulfobacteriota bacterium]